MLEPTPYDALRRSRAEPSGQQPRIGIRQLIQQLRQRPTQVVPTPQPPTPQATRSIMRQSNALPDLN